MVRNDIPKKYYDYIRFLKLGQTVREKLDVENKG